MESYATTYGIFYVILHYLTLSCTTLWNHLETQRILWIILWDIRHNSVSFYTILNYPTEAFGILLWNPMEYLRKGLMESYHLILYHLILSLTILYRPKESYGIRRGPMESHVMCYGMSYSPYYPILCHIILWNRVEPIGIPYAISYVMLHDPILSYIILYYPILSYISL